jgi:hypothetical protein
MLFAVGWNFCGIAVVPFFGLSFKRQASTDKLHENQPLRFPAPTRGIEALSYFASAEKGPGADARIMKM